MPYLLVMPGKCGLQWYRELVDKSAHITPNCMGTLSPSIMHVDSSVQVTCCSSIESQEKVHLHIFMTLAHSQSFHIYILQWDWNKTLHNVKPSLRESFIPCKSSKTLCTKSETLFVTLAIHHSLLQTTHSLNTFRSILLSLKGSSRPIESTIMQI
jgi:hypothetical protein